ncbi:11040_t:CDS:2 [Entrophospora sp. SA101]|nr:11040_t:CDS:2 [Entrophospora sp. SA101]CAJ0873324.1 13015_t:CDS:2 [Entrophospora sp. SA101]
MATKAAFKRLTKEYISIQNNPVPYLIAKPLENNILEWHYVIRGPQDTPYHNGEYHGVLQFPVEYPFKPPSIRMTTPSGRFQTDTRLCLSMSDFHPSSWNPSWGVATILNGLLSFMTSDETTTGSIKTSDIDKKTYASRSHQFNLKNPKFRETTTSNNLLQNNNQIKKRSKLLSQNLGSENENNINQSNSNNNNNNNVQRSLFDKWRNWIIVTLVCLYLVLSKILARKYEAITSSDHGEMFHP